MRLRELAEGLARLEALTSRRQMTGVVADLLERAAPAERELVVHLLQGALRPPYEGIEIGLGEKLLIRVLSTAYRTPQASLIRKLRAAGDLGVVAASLSGAGGRVGVTVRQAHRILLTVARTTGPRSVGTKIALLADLLAQVGPLEAKLVVRVAQGRLRLGVGDQTILEATAVAALGGRAEKAALERVYNVRPDLGAVVRLAFSGGRPALAAVGPEPGIPVRPALAQRLPSAAAIIARLGRVQVEPKYDGLRLQLHRAGRRVWIFSRRLENLTAMFPDLAAGLRRQLSARRAIIEGEAVGYRPATGEFVPFQLTMTRKRKTGIAETAERTPIRLFAFDLLHAGATSYLDHPQRERSRRLRRLLPFTADDPLSVTEARVTGRAADLEAYFEDMIGRGLEGIVAKRLDAPYRAGARGFDWVKLKRAYRSQLRDTVDVALVGYFRGRGRRSSLGVGSLLGAVYDPGHDRFRTVARIGSGLSDDDWRSLRRRLDERATKVRPRRVDSVIVPDVWVEPTIVVEVLADEITRSPSHTCGKTGAGSGYSLRFPRLLGIRADKAPADATSEAEIRGLFRARFRRGSRRGTGSKGAPPNA